MDMDTAITRHPTVDPSSQAPHHHVLHRSSCTEMLTLDNHQLQHRQFAADNRCGQDAANPKKGFPSSLSAASSGHLDVLPLHFDLINLRCTPPLLFFRGRPNSRRHAASSLHPFGAPTGERSKKTLAVAILAHGRGPSLVPWSRHEPGWQKPMFCFDILQACTCHWYTPRIFLTR